MTRRTLLAFSGGKDSVAALVRLRARPELEVVGLVATVGAEDRMVPLHGAGLDVLRRQAAALGLPLHLIELPRPCPDAVYAERLRAFLKDAARARVRHLAFGDIHLSDVRAFREALLEGTGVTPLFPLWGEDSDALARWMVDAGIRARLCCVDLRRLDAGLLGASFDAALLSALPEGVDPCGEGGEFHTVVTDGPGFARPVAVTMDGPVREGDFARMTVRAAPGAESPRAGRDKAPAAQAQPGP